MVGDCDFVNVRGSDAHQWKLKMNTGSRALAVLINAQA